MPAKSEKQQRYMAMLAHNPKKRKGTGISKKVAEEFSHKPKGGYKNGVSDYRAMTRSLYGSRKGKS